MRAPAWGLLAIETCFAAAYSTAAEEPERSTRQVVEIEVQDDRERAALLRLGEELEGFEVWEDRIDDNRAVVLVRSSDRYRLEYLPTRITIDDWDSYRTSLLEAADGQDFFAGYHTYAEYVAYLGNLAAEYPDLAQAITFGQSVEGRVIEGIRISGAPATVQGVFYHGVQHGNEITNAPVLVYLADYLLNHYEIDADIRYLVDNTEWYILPITNPDGHEKGSRYNANRVDLNRDWDYAARSGGFSQPETAALRDFLTAHQNIVWHVDFHTGTQMILWPWGRNDRRCWDYDVFDSVAGHLAATISGYSTYGPIYSTIYPVLGDATDYAYGALGMLSFSIEVSSAYAANPASLPAYETRMRDLALYLAEWLHDCDEDGVPNPALDCLPRFADATYLSMCIDHGGPGRTAAKLCDGVDWDNDSDVDLRDTARWMLRMGSSH